VNTNYFVERSKWHGRHNGFQSILTHLGGPNPWRQLIRFYVIDETQEVAKDFCFNGRDEPQYHGRLDALRIQPVANTRCDPFNAMKQIAETGHGPLEQTCSMGRSIK
jgi:hypothetical protein